MTGREQTRRNEPSRYADPYTRLAWYEERLEQAEARLAKVLPLVEELHRFDWDRQAREALAAWENMSPDE